MTMAKDFIIYLLVLSSAAVAAGDWFTQSFKEDASNHYYVGVSEGKTNLNEALEIAYQNAIDEALRHNFGFKKQGQKSFQNSLFKSSLDERSFIKTQTITLKDIKPGLQDVKKTDNGTYLVYRQIVYPKVAIEKEKRRLSILKKEEEFVPNEYGLQGRTQGQVLIKTYPSNAQILLTRVDGKGSVNGTGDARFRVPLGEYHVTVIKDGHLPRHDKIIVSGKESTIEYRLKESLGYLKLDITPSDSKVYVDNQKAENGETIPLKVGRDYTVRIEHSDYLTHIQSVSPWIDQTVVIDNNLTPKKARITVITQPAGATIMIGSQLIGKTPIKSFPIEPEDGLVLKISKDGFDSQFHTIDLKPNHENAPLVTTLKKQSPRKPTSVEKVSYSEDKDGYFDLSFLSNNQSRHSLIYNPVVGDNEGASLVLIPFHYQYYIWRHLAFGFDYRYHIEEERIEAFGKEYDKEIVSQVWSVNSTFYLIRNRKFSLGFGPEYTWRKKQVRYLNSEREARLSSTSAQKEALGYKGHMQIGLMERVNGYQFGVNFDYRRYDYRNTDLGSWSVGVYWEF